MHWFPVWRPRKPSSSKNPRGISLPRCPTHAKQPRPWPAFVIRYYIANFWCHINYIAEFCTVLIIVLITIFTGYQTVRLSLQLSVRKKYSCRNILLLPRSTVISRVSISSPHVKTLTISDENWIPLLCDVMRNYIELETVLMFILATVLMTILSGNLQLCFLCDW